MKTISHLLIAACLMLGITACGPRIDEKLKFPVDAKYAKWVGKPATGVKFTAIDGRVVDLNEMRNKVVLLDFWATWCGPCMAELPNLKAVYDELHPKGFEIIGISFDNDLAPLKSVVQQQRIPWPQFFEPGENRFGRMFDIDHFPSMWLVDQKGIIRFISAGEDLKGKVLKLMQESPTTPSTDPVPPPPRTPPANMRHLKLTGFSGNPEKPLVLLNSGTKTHTFGENDEQTLQTPGGELKVRCVKIHERSAKFIVGDGFELELKVY